MANDRKTFVVVNPNSANGSTRRLWPEIEEKISAAIGCFEWRFTCSQGDATRITREALNEGYDQIVALGGDGTNNEVVNGFFVDGKPINPQAAFAFICRGTGGDFRKTFGWGIGIDEALARIKGDKERCIDLGSFSYLSHQGETKRSIFINITSFGIGGLVDHYVNTTSKAFGGKASFLFGTVRALLTYRNQPVTLRLDDGPAESHVINSVAVANGRFFGGGMMVAPNAEPDDGLFDVVIMGDWSKTDMVTHGTDIYKGEHLKHAKTQVRRARKLTATSEQKVLLDMDGEAPGRLPCEFQILPKALRLKG